MRLVGHIVTICWKCVLKGKILHYLCGCPISVDGKLKQHIPQTKKAEFPCYKIGCISVTSDVVGVNN